MSMILALLVAGAAPVADPKQAVRLDALIAAKKYGAFRDAVTRPKSREEAIANLNWMKERWVGGTTALVPMLYARVLWQTGAAAPLGDPKYEANRGMALAAWLYVLGVSSIDGARCADKSAPANRVNQLTQLLPNFAPTVKSLDPDTRRQAVTIAVALEQKTAAVRDKTADATFFCTDGLEEARFIQQQRGKGGVYVPRLQPDTVWRPAAAKARASMAGDLNRLVAKIVATPTPAGK